MRGLFVVIKSVDASTLKNWIDSNQAVLIDVREPAEHASEKIEGAYSIPLGIIKLSDIPHYADKKLILHCRSGKRSHNACEKLLTANPNLNIYTLEGGISAWIDAGYNILKSGKSILPLDRQVQLTIGIVLIISSILGLVISPKLFFVTGLIGVGLSVAGITGFCGLAMLIAKMPWNQKGSTIGYCTKK